MRRLKAHILSDQEEELLAQVGSLSRTPETIYNMLEYNIIQAENGKKAILDCSNNYTPFLHTFVSIFDAYVQQQLFYARARKYPSTLEMYLYESNISKEVYMNLIETVHKHVPLLHRYVKLHKQLLGVDELHMYNLFTPVIDEFDMKIPFEEAKETVKESLKPLGKVYLTALQEGFNNRWIDIYENKGKHTDSYTRSTYGTHPYVLLNYTDNLRSMVTLTHEMGHALHEYYLNNYLSYRDAACPPFLTEIASALNETLLFDYLLKKTMNKQEKLFLLIYYIDHFFMRVFCYTQNDEFNMIIHDHAEQGKALTSELLCDIYYDLLRKYYGNDIVIDSDADTAWVYCWNLYKDFGGYEYAMGFLVAQNFAKQILEEGQPAVERYKSFLKSGYSNFPIPILQQAGIDISMPQFIEESMRLLESLIAELEQLYKLN